MLSFGDSFHNLRAPSPSSAVTRSNATTGVDLIIPSTSAPLFLYSMMPYERLRAWRACDDLTVAVYKATEAFPRHELYGITSQARRAAFSAAANIAEGAAKRGSREFARFLGISIGSLSEVAYALHLAKRLEYLSLEEWQSLDR
jgi:four helix bundle protein